LRILTKIRIFLAWYLIHKFKFDKRYFFARIIAPSSDKLIRDGKSKNDILLRPNFTHIIYHQATVDDKCAINSLKSIFFLNNISEHDEVIFYNNGSRFDALKLFDNQKFDWFSEVFSKTDVAEKKSYTYGLNHLISGAKANNIIVWRTDYVYPAGIYEKYLEHLTTNEFAAPYYVIIGKKHCNSDYVEKNWDKITSYDKTFWETNGTYISLYETQDPALFGIRKSLWLKIDGLNNSLWGYGWQFAEFAARVRLNTHKKKIEYFVSPPPLHQTHVGTQMHQEQNNEHKVKEFNDGLQRFANFLGGQKALYVYKLKWILKPDHNKSIKQKSED